MEPSPTAGKMPKMGPRKKDNYLKDFLRWAEFSGLEISPNARDLMKIDARPALCAAMVAAELGHFQEFHHPAYRARWCEGRDISRREVLAELLTDAGLDADAALEQADAAATQAELERQTQAAIDRGMFGVPTIFIGDQMFWGNDRFELVRFYLQRTAAGDRAAG